MREFLTFLAACGIIAAAYTTLGMVLSWWTGRPFWCALGLHKWPCPGGACEECGRIDGYNPPEED